MENFEFQVQKDSEFLKNLDSLCKLIEERVAIEDQHIRNVEKITCKLEQLKFEGDISDLVKEICLGQREQLNGAKNHVSLVKGEILELLKKSVKGQIAQNKSFKTTQKTLNDEYIQTLDKFSKSKEEYIAHTKDFDLVALETEISALNQKVDYDKKIEAREKCIKLQKATETKKETFFLHSFQYNDFLDNLEKESETLNRNLVEHKQESVRVLKKALTVFLDFEKVAVSEFTQKIEPFYPQINGLNMTTNTEQNLRIITTIPNNFQVQQQSIERSSFLKEGLKEIQELNCSNEKEEETISAFRQYFQNFIKSNQPNSDEISHLSIKENLDFVANTIHKAWQGESLDQHDTEKMKDLMNEKLFRNIFVVCLQQYRLAGQFTLNFVGFENIKDMLSCFLEKCFTEKDTLNAYKIIILSQTFWRNLVLSVGRDAEKVYLQSTIKTMEIWKDLDFWQAAIFTSLYKELLFKNSARNQADEHKNDSAENQNLIVTGLLMSFIHVMNDFEVERKSILIIIKQFNQYYSLGEATMKELETIVDHLSLNGKDTSKCLLVEPKTNNNFNILKKSKLESIKNLFNKKNTSNGPRTIIETQTKLIEGKTK